MRRAALAVGLALVAAAPAAAAPLELGVQDDPVLVRHPASYGGIGAGSLIGWDRAYAALDALGVEAVRMNVAWAEVASGDGYDWGTLDAAVDRARAAGKRVQLTLTGPAPRTASGDGRVSYLRPDPVKFAAFTGAAAAHFAGRVSRYSIWNEPNWHTYLLPRASAARQYRALYRRAHAAIKAVDPASEVLIGELAPMSRPEAAISPLRFLRGVTCSDRRWRAARRCAPLRADGFAHHPYTLRWSPGFPGPGRDDVTTGSLHRLNGALTKLARRGALSTPAGKPLGLYLTEWGFHADSRSIPEPLRSRYLREGLDRITRTPRVRQVIWYQLAGPPKADRRIWDTALLDRRGRERPAFRALRAWSAGPVAAAAGVRALAASSWGPERVLDEQPTFERGVATHANDRGDVAVAWASSRGVRVAVARRGGAVGRPVTIRSRGGAYAPQVRVSRSGAVAVAFQYWDGTREAEPSARDEGCCSGTKVAVVRRDGTVTRVRTVTRRGIDTWLASEHPTLGWSQGGRFAMAVTEGGGAGRVWLVTGGARRGVVRSRRVAFREPQPVAVAFRGERAHVLIARDERRGKRLYDMTESGRRTRAGFLRGYTERLAVADDGRGRQMLLTGSNYKRKIVVRLGRRTVGERFRMRVVDRVRGRFAWLRAPSLAVAHGRFAAAWIHNSQTVFRIRAGRLGGFGRRGPNVRLRRTEPIAHSSRIGLGPRGRAVLTWNQQQRGEPSRGWAVPLAGRHAAGRPQPVSGPGSHYDLPDAPHVHATPGGGALVFTWRAGRLLYRRLARR